MATTVKTWLLDSTAEYGEWPFTLATNVLGTHNTTTTDADGISPIGQIQFRHATQNNTTRLSFAEWAGTWEQLGVPAGHIVTAVQWTYARRCAEYNGGRTGQTFGPIELRDSAATLLNTLLGTSGFSAVTAYADGVSPTVGIADQPSSASIRLRANVTTGTSNTAGAAITVLYDWFRLTITHAVAPPAAPTGVSATSVAQPVVSWTPGARTTTLYVHRLAGGSAAPTGASTRTSDALGGVAVSWTDEIAPASQVLDYWVEAVNGSGSTFSASPGTATTPAAPVGNVSFGTAALTRVRQLVAGTFALSGGGGVPPSGDTNFGTAILTRVRQLVAGAFAIGSGTPVGGQRFYVRMTGAAVEKPRYIRTGGVAVRKPVRVRGGTFSEDTALTVVEITEVTVSEDTNLTTTEV